MINGERRHTTPVVDTGREERCEIVTEVRRRLQVNVGGQDQTGGGDRPEELVGRARLGAMHRGAELRQEVLDDDLLHVTVLEVRIGDRDECLDALGPRLTDPDEDAGGERHARPARGMQGGEAARRGLVGRAEVRAAGLVQPVGERLDHHPLRRADGAEAEEVGFGQRTRVGVRQQPRLFEHPLRHRGHVVDGVRVAVCGQPFRGDGVTVFGRLAQREQRLEAAERGTLGGQLDHVVGVEIRRLEPGGRLGKGAIAAPVAAQHRERDEHLRRVRDAPARPGIAPRGRLRQQLGQGRVEQLPERLSAEHAATLVGSQCSPVSDPEHLPGPDAGAGEILSGPDARDRVALLVAFHRHDREHRTFDRGKGEGQPGIRVQVVAARDDETLAFVGRGRAREQRRGMTVGTQAEVHDVDGRRGPHERVVRVGAGPDHGVHGPRTDCVEQHAPGDTLVRVVRFDRHHAFVAEVHVDARPRHRLLAQRGIAPVRELTARQRDRSGCALGDEPGEGAGYIVDDTNLSGKLHVCHSSRRMDRPTVNVYETRVDEWIEHRRRARPAGIDAFAARVPPGVRADVGCGPGWHSADLGSPVVAFDASPAMTAQVRTFAPDAWPVVADLEHLPFRDHALTGAWAQKSYMHITAERLPMALADLHRTLVLDAAVHIQVTSDRHAPTDNDRFGNRHFTNWGVVHLRDVVEGAGFVIDDLVDDGEEWIDIEATRAHMLADTVGPGMRVLIVGLNPGLLSADVGRSFARPGNRFWPAALASGLVTRTLDPFHALQVDRVGMTNIVRRATARADELDPGEYGTGTRRLERLVHWLQPAVVCFVGITGYRTAVDKQAVLGWQTEPFGGARTYVMPNTSGLNAHAKPADFTEHLRTVVAATL